MQGVSNILVGVDLHHGDRIATDDWGESTQAAIDEAVIIANASNAQITLCGVLELSEMGRHLVEVDEKRLQTSVEDVARAALNRLADSLRTHSVTVNSVVRVGRAWDELTRQAVEGHHELVVVGTRSRNLAARLLFGSTAQKLIRHCPVPVWIAKPGEVREIREILVATDFSDAAFAALQTAVSFAQAVPSKLFVLHALEYPMEPYLRTAGLTEDEMTKYRNRMHDDVQQRMLSQLQRTDCRTLKYGVKTEIIEGAPDAVVPQFIIDHEIDLLVMGTHGRSGLTGALLGNTAERMLPSVHCSLLAVKSPGFANSV